MSFSAVPADHSKDAGSARARAPSFLRELAFGLRGRLLLAFVAISLFVIAAAIAGLYALHQVGQTLDRITIETVPAALQARELSRKSEKIVAAGPALANATDANQVDAISSQALSELVDALTLHAHLRAADLDPGALARIDAALAGLRQHVELLRSARLDTLAASQRKARVIGDTFAAYRQFEAIWRPRFTDLRSRVLGLQRTMTSPNSSSEQRRRALDQFDQAMVDMLSLDQIRREAGVTFELIMRAGDASNNADLDPLQEQAQRSIRAIDGLVSDIDPDVSLKLFDPLRSLRAAAVGNGSIFGAVRRENTARIKIRDLIAEDALLAKRLKDAVDLLVAGSRRDLAGANTEAQRVQTLGREVLIGVAGLSLASSFLIVWLYVGRNIVARLTRLGRVMIEIASGERQTTVPATGTDEVAAMGRAVEVFRRNAIELDRLLAERAEAAARLEKIVEERTAELAWREAELRVMFENLPQGIAMFDGERKLVAANRHFQEILRLPDELVGVGATFDGFFRLMTERGEFGPGDVEEMVRQRVYRSAEAYYAERVRPDGSILEIRRNPVPGGGFVSIYSDITERKRAEEQIRAARDAAERALQELQATQAKLIHTEKMASLGQLTAGIAHEIKNPLNFVNNFAGLSVELLNELKAAAGPGLAALDDDARAEIDETIQMLTSNMDKIAEHGRRADGIVKSMLAHSRGTSGERQEVDINSLVEESVNLAYHGARAQDQNFNITLERDFAPGIPPIELVPQDVTRVFLNLIGNGFYAAHKRGKEAGDPKFRPVLSVTTRDDGGEVEIRVRDNGTGIRPEHRDKLFQPFFTTKPTGEGTGLGLSISYDIVTQQHGGTIAVDSAVGEFTEFTVRLPHASKKRLTAEGAKDAQRTQ